MKLDSRIIEGKKPLNCFDAEEAEKFVGQKGYASDDISTFTDLDGCCESGKLEYVVKENGNGICYPYSVVTDYNRKEYAFFLPAAWVKNTEEQQQFAEDSLQLTVLIYEFFNSHKHPAEIMKRHEHERNRFLQDVCARVLSGDPYNEVR